ncbi:hypothetical protein GUJ93_ZPchr0004g39348 [Zizania palustris]|uniref:Uncharacterized protein n=1 Tax=Zizania palustris TaxID=103762 RepID=A0A8J5SKL3_ZIZPA|nr:hypothetical protein GUJ93_ZPchr0004g39348 [Zizania palustris]
MLRCWRAGFSVEAVRGVQYLGHESSGPYSGAPREEAPGPLVWLGAGSRTALQASAQGGSRFLLHRR